MILEQLSVELSLLIVKTEEDLNKLDADRESFILQNMTDLEHEIRDLKKSNDNLQAENDVLQKLQGIL